MRSFITSLALGLLLIGTGTAQTAPVHISRETKWKAVSDLSATTSMRVKEVKEDGKDPRRFTQVITTFLSYADIAVAVYYRPKSLREAEKLKTAVEVGVLAKALFEYNVRRDPKLSDQVCLYETCNDRTLVYPLSYETLGIKYSPINVELRYSTRLITGDH